MPSVIFAYIDEPPFAIPTGGAWPGGCDAALAQSVLNVMGVHDAGTRLVTFDELLDGVARHLWTLNTGIFISDERKKHVRFSRPIWGLCDGLMMQRRHGQIFATYERIGRDASARLGIVKGQVQRETALSAGVPAERIAIFATPEQALAALRSGAISAYASVAMAHRGLLQRSPDDTLTFSDLGAPEFSGCAGSVPAFGAFSCAKDDAAFADALDDALAQFLGSPAHIEMMAHYGFRVKDGIALA
ncbi:MAG: transporter substrate-binding domain-containing protein [Parvibaculaceae bacterium]